MIKKLHLKNFKSHRDTCLEIRPLTIISGVNNIGKSSVLQSLLLLRQSFNKKRLNKFPNMKNLKQIYGNNMSINLQINEDNKINNSRSIQSVDA